MTQKTTEQDIAEEIEKRLTQKEEGYGKRFDGPSNATRKRWTKKIVQQVETEKAQLAFDF